MNRKLIAVAIITSLASLSLVSADMKNSRSSAVVVSKSADSRADKPEYPSSSGQHGYLNPADSADFATIMEHLGYAQTMAEASPMFYRMVEQARAEALMQPSLYVLQAGLAPEEEAMHHSVLMPKRFFSSITNEVRLLNSATVNVTGNIAFAYTTVVLKDPAGRQIGVPGSRRVYAGEANRSVALGDVDSAFIRDNYQPSDQFSIESFAMTQDNSGKRLFHKMTNRLYARALMNGDGLSSYNGLLKIEAPDQTPEHKASQAPNIKVCLNRDHGDCDIPQLYDAQTPNAQLKIKIPLKGEIETFHEITQVYAPGEGDAAITGNETGAWIMAGNAGANGEWASMRNPRDARSFFDYIEIRHFVDVEGFVGTRLTWDIPMEDAVFGVGAATAGTMFKRFENVQWEIRIKVKSQDTIDMDGDIATTDDRFSPFTDEYGNPETIETVFVAENADLASNHTDWVLAEKLPYLYFEYSCVAKGTLITLPAGAVKPIEELIIGDLVAGKGGLMRVMDTSIGYEALPMIEIRDDQGHRLLLTETHPVVTTNRGVVWAQEVQPGDRLSTDLGTTTVLSVGKELFNDTVHNLELEPILGEDDAHEVMFANGIAIGDLGYQSALSFKDKAPTTVEGVLLSLPIEWHEDYLNSLK